MVAADVSAKLASGEVEFLDAGSGVGGSIEHVVKRFGRGRGLGLELNPDDVASAVAGGYQVVEADVTKVAIPERSVAYASAMDFLEHLADERTALDVLERLVRGARDFVFIRHPSFEDIAYLADFGLKITWTDWDEHQNMLRLADYRRWFANHGLNDYVIRPRGAIRDSWSRTVVPADAPRNAQLYDPAFGPKEFVAFDRPVYTQFDIFVRTNQGMARDEWDRITAPDPEPSDATPGDGVGVYDPATAMWYLRPDVVTGLHRFSFGPPGTRWLPIVGDWSGSGVAGPGLYDPELGIFFLKNELTDGPADRQFSFGKPGGVPVVGDWTGSGCDSVGLFYPETGVWFLMRDGEGGEAHRFSFGAPAAGLLPVAGDWDGDGVDSVALYEPSSAQWHLLEALATGAGETIVPYGHAGALPVAGDWTAGGRDTIGVYVAAEAAFHLRNENASGEPDITVVFGPDCGVPVVGRWDARSRPMRA